ncbi:MAG: prolyl oligopeptidase family serine peptidase [Gemmatimonadetes bacterium]|nr:prolyl oligopeptidase family serine peptidase [Gemmatimonadota bacterium]
MRFVARIWPGTLLAFLPLFSPTAGVHAQDFTFEDMLSPPYPSEMVSARDVDRIAWISVERGRRNVFTAAAPDFTPVRLTHWDEDNGHDLTSIRISDDGEVLVFVRGHTPNSQGWVANPNNDPRGAERAIWALGTRGREAWRVVEGSNPALSPDGRWVLFVKDGQIYRAPVNTGTALTERADELPPLFRAWGRNGNPTWSPDGRYIAFVSQRDDHSFIGVYDTEQPSVRYMAPGVDRDTQPSWSPDGARIAFRRQPGLPFGARVSRPDDVPRDSIPPGLEQARFAGGYTNSVWIAEMATGKGREVWHSEPDDDRFENTSNLMWAHNHLVFQAEPGNWRHYWSVPVEGHEGDPKELTPGEGMVEYVALSKDGRTLYYAANTGDIHRRDLFSAAADGGRKRQITRGDLIETKPASLASDDQVAVLMSGASLPLSVGLVPSDGGEARTITDLPARFPMNRHVTPANVTLTAEDGFDFYNQLFLPPDLKPGEERPALIFIHGGSRRQMFLGYHDRIFYHWAYGINQYFANRGYVVLSVNYRSGIGYGKEFRNAPGRMSRGNTEYGDILAAGRYLQSREDVDPERVGLWGLSYGGILTAQGLARNSDVFAAGVDIAGVHQYGNTLDPSDTAYASSSVSEVDNWTSPVLLVHGDDDRNVAFSQTVGLVQALRANDVHYELIVFPDEVHDFLVFDKWLLTWDATEDFFRRFLLEKE